MRKQNILTSIERRLVHQSEGQKPNSLWSTFMLGCDEIDELPLNISLS